jgi:hypothetical protein
LSFGSAFTDYSYDRQSPGLYAQYEKGLWDAGPGVISLGGYVGSKSYKGYFYEERWNYTILGFRGAYHYNRFTNEKLQKFDPYGGLMLSLSLLSYRSNPNANHRNAASSFDQSLFVGGRYYFTNSFAGFAELGFGISNFSLGAALKF